LVLRVWLGSDEPCGWNLAGMHRLSLLIFLFFVLFGFIRPEKDRHASSHSSDEFPDSLSLDDPVSGEKGPLANKDEAVDGVQEHISSALVNKWQAHRLTEAVDLKVLCEFLYLVSNLGDL
jgi:hypothetical protein